MVKRIRVILAVLVILSISLLFLDFTGTAHFWLGWMAKIQFLPAILALNAGVVLFLLMLTLILGRIYCSIICPLGIFQDIVSWLSGKLQKGKRHFSYSPAKSWLRYGMLGILVLVFLLGLQSIVAIFDPYAAFGRMVTSLLSPLYGWGNNLLADWAEKMDSYAVYSVDVWIKGGAPLILAIATLVVITILAWRNGRTYCNTICPVGTLLGFLSKYSLFVPTLNKEMCISCGLCARSCKASCIDSKKKEIDYSRCVVCFDCMGTCKRGGVTYQRRSFKKSTSTPQVDTGRRAMLTASALLVASTAVKAAKKHVDGGLAHIEDKQVPQRQTPIVPPGALSIQNLTRRCTACQLCVSACPSQVLRPSSDLSRLMMPESSFERGYCRPECTRCSNACPTGAIQPITPEEKSSIQVGHAVFIKNNCVAYTRGVLCGNCARHCPVGAITMVPSDPKDESSIKIPAIDEERCIGCGACENLCPSRPFSAIYVEGHEVHKIV
ncbi:MAG: 4Fe-4S dicluster domain-containing protein [Paludibacteraceae bacterium]|nr:4Fe-4S dicluster domain-containing protein [Paludibacteraceae bacterium]